jgi:hypothetical protein
MRARLVRAAAVLVAVLGIAWPAGAGTLNVSSRAMTVSQSCTLTGTSGTSTVGVDTYVRQGQATTNFGTATTMNVQTALTDNRRMYVRFDLTKCRVAIPSTATVKIAYLALYMTAVPNQCRTYDVFRAPSTWSETAVTWNNQPFGITPNNPPNGERTDFATVGTGGTCEYTTANQYIAFDVTTDVQAFVGGTTNNGWMIRDDAELSATARSSTFSTKNANNVARAPILIVNYVR